MNEWDFDDIDPRAYCPCCGSGPGQECDEICKQIQKEMSEENEG